MTVIDPQPLQIIEHKQRMVQERLKSNMAKQYDLQQEEGKLRTELTHLENSRYLLVKTEAN